MYYDGSEFNLRNGQKLPQRDKNSNPVFTDAEFNNLLPLLTNNSTQVEFNPFHRYQDNLSDGSYSALISVDYPPNPIPEERYVFAYVRQRENNVWVRAEVEAFEVNPFMNNPQTGKKERDLGRYIFVSYRTSDPRQRHPKAVTNNPTYDSFAVVVTNVKGESIAGGVSQTPLWESSNFVIEAAKPPPIR